VLAYNFEPSTWIPCVKLGFEITTVRMTPLEGVLVRVKAVIPKPLSTTRRFPFESKVMPRGVVRLEKRTFALNPGATVTGALNDAPLGWNVDVDAATMPATANALNDVVRSSIVLLSHMILHLHLEVHSVAISQLPWKIMRLILAITAVTKADEVTDAGDYDGSRTWGTWIQSRKESSQETIVEKPVILQ
jgi:hypothetical protein